MTLKELLPKYIGCNVKIGARCGFIFCGVINNNINLILENLSKKSLNNLEMSIKDLTYHLSAFDKYWRKKLYYKLDAILIDKNLTPDEKQKQTKAVKNEIKKEKEKDLKRTNIALDQKKEWLKNFKPILEREVLEEYDSITPQSFDEKIIHIAGHESGSMWFKK